MKREERGQRKERRFKNEEKRSTELKGRKE